MIASARIESRRAAIYLCQTIFTSGLPVIALVILARYLNKEDFGMLALAQVYAVFAAGICSFGMTEVFERGYFEYRGAQEKLAALLFGILVFVLTNFLVMAVLSYMFASAIASTLGFNEPGGLVLSAFCGQFFSTTGMIALLYYRNSGQALLFAGFIVLAAILSFAGALVLVIYTGIGVVGIPIAQFMAWLTVFVLASVCIGSVLSPRLDWDIFAASFRLAYPLAPRILLGTISSQIDKFLLGQLATVSAVGIYSIAQRLAYMVFVFMTALQNVYSPNVYSRMFDLRGGDDGALGRYLTPYAYLSVLAALTLLLLGEEIIKLMLPGEYHAAVGVLIVLCMYYGILFFGKLTGKQLMYAKRPGLVSLLTLVAVLVNIAVCYPMAKWWGAMGVAWGTMLTGLVSGGLYLVVAQRYYRIRWQWPAMAAIYAVLMVAGIGLLLAEATLPYTIRVIGKFFALAAYLYVGYRLGLATVANLRSLGRGLVSR